MKIPITLTLDISRTRRDFIASVKKEVWSEIPKEAQDSIVYSLRNLINQL